MTLAALPKVRGKLTPNAPLAPLVWFKSGGAAQWLFEPADLADLQQFLRELDLDHFGRTSSLRAILRSRRSS